MEDGTEPIVEQPVEKAGESTPKAVVAAPIDFATELSNLQVRLTQAEEARKSEARATSKKEAELQRLSKQLEEREADREYFKILAASIAELQGKTESEFTEEVKTKKPDLLQKFNELEQQRAFKKLQEQTNEIQKRVESLGYTEDDIEYEEIKDAIVRSGNARLAEMKLSKLQPKKIEPVVEKEDPAIRAKEIEEAARKMLEQKGLLKTDAIVSVATAKGRRPSLDELKASDPFETAKKYKSGEWA